MKAVGVVFPGQGSQSVGMLAEIAGAFPEVIQTFSEASQAVGYDLWKLVQEGPAEKLDQTIHTQPALLAASYAIWRAIQANKPFRPTMIAGHSLGEYSALVAANALSLQDAIKLVAARGKYMQEAVPLGQGAVAAIIGLDDTKVSAICQEAAQDEALSPANFNSVGQVVIAGHANAVTRALSLAKEAGARMAKRLPVSVPSHCILMKPAAEQLKQLLATMTIQAPTFPVLNNVDVNFYENADQIRDGLIRQLYMPVRWVEIIQAFKRNGITHIIECGPGKVLTGLNKRIDAELQLTHTADLGSLHVLLETSLQAE